MSNSLYLAELLFDMPTMSIYKSWKGVGFGVSASSYENGGTVSFNYGNAHIDVEEQKDINGWGTGKWNETWFVSGTEVTIMDTGEWTPYQLLVVRTMLTNYKADEYIKMTFEKAATNGNTIQIFMDDYVHAGDGTTETWLSYNETHNAAGVYSADVDGSNISRISLNPYKLDDNKPLVKIALIHETLHEYWPLEGQHERLVARVDRSIENIFEGSALDTGRFDSAHFQTGTDSGETLTGSGYFSNSLFGLGGPDTIIGSNLDDYVDGGPGNDNISTGGGNDIINPGTGIDFMAGGLGDDTYLLLADPASEVDPYPVKTIYDAGGERDILYFAHDTEVVILLSQEVGSTDMIVYGLQSHTTVIIKDGQTAGPNGGMIEIIGLADGTEIHQTIGVDPIFSGF